MIDFFDNRKWSDRRISKYTLIFSVVFFLINLAVSLYYSDYNSRLVKKANDLNESTFCINLVHPKTEQLKEILYDLPRLISGCAYRPQEYCREARSKLHKINQLNVFVINNLSKNKEQFLNLKSAATEAVTKFDSITNDRHKELDSVASKFVSLRREFKDTNLKDFNCIK